MAQDNTPPGPIFKARFLLNEYDSETERHVCGTALDEIHLSNAAPLSGLTLLLFSLWIRST